MPTRRQFLQHSVAAAAGASLVGLDGRVLASNDSSLAEQDTASRSFIDLHRQPDSVVAQLSPTSERALRLSGGRWDAADVSVTISPAQDSVAVELVSSTAVRKLRLRWRGRLDDVRLISGDAWERGYGDLEWRGFVPDRVMPWYVATSDGTRTHAYGVRTGAKAFCFWQVDPQGITLWADVRSGGAGVELGDRALDVCDDRHAAADARANRRSRPSTRSAGRCARIRGCRRSRSTAATTGTGRTARTAPTPSSPTRSTSSSSRPTEPNRPFAVIDDGWQPERGQAKSGVGTWDRGNEKFPDMPGLAARDPQARRAAGHLDPSAARAGRRAGRVAAAARPHHSRSDGARGPAEDRRRHRARARAGATSSSSTTTRRSTSSAAGDRRWATALTRDGWTFAAGPTRTTAEVIDELYRTIRDAAGDALVIGCNTVSHLSAGVFDICRIGDDTSGREWARTRKMGVNTLAFRGAQHGAFYVADADCVGVTTAVPVGAQPAVARPAGAQRDDAVRVARARRARRRPASRSRARRSRWPPRRSRSASRSTGSRRRGRAGGG